MAEISGISPDSTWQRNGTPRPTGRPAILRRAPWSPSPAPPPSAPASAPRSPCVAPRPSAPRPSARALPPTVRLRSSWAPRSSQPRISTRKPSCAPCSSGPTPSPPPDKTSPSSSPSALTRSPRASAWRSFSPGGARHVRLRGRDRRAGRDVESEVARLMVRGTGKVAVKGALVDVPAVSADHARGHQALHRRIHGGSVSFRRRVPITRVD